MRWSHHTVHIVNPRQTLLLESRFVIPKQQCHGDYARTFLRSVDFPVAPEAWSLDTQAVMWAVICTFGSP